ncbi:MAG: hypothetical protein ACJ77M_16450 [Thermoleophilaceae bacterium]
MEDILEGAGEPAGAVMNGRHDRVALVRAEHHQDDADDDQGYDYAGYQPDDSR